MAKMKLVLDQLAVETFETAAAGSGGGTVLAMEGGTAHTDCWGMCGVGGTYGCGSPTMDPEAIDCYSFVIDCPQTDPNFYCGETAIVYCNPTAAQCYPATSPETGC